MHLYPISKQTELHTNLIDNQITINDDLLHVQLFLEFGYIF